MTRKINPETRDLLKKILSHSTRIICGLALAAIFIFCFTGPTISFLAKGNPVADVHVASKIIVIIAIVWSIWMGFKIAYNPKKYLDWMVF